MMMDCQKFQRCFLAALLLVGVAVAPGNPLMGQTRNLKPGMLDERGEEVVRRPTGFSAVVTLDDDGLATLVKEGAVEISIPDAMVHNVESVIIKRPFYFKEKHALDYGDTRVVAGKMLLDVDDSIVERIDYQPVELKVYESDFTAVVLRYTGRSPNLDDQKLGDPQSDSPVLTVKLKSGKGISGRIRGMKTLELDSTIGKISVLFARATRIDVREDGELSVEIVNGDRISGAVNGGKIELVNRWGNEIIRMSDIDSLQLRKPGKKFGQRRGANRF